jgi:hypothetical protein
MKKEVLIARILEVVSTYGGFSTSEVQSDCGICVGSLGNLVGMVEYISKDCIDVSVYSPNRYSSDSVYDYTMQYSELSKQTLLEILLFCDMYVDLVLEEDHLFGSAVGN